MIYDIFFVAVYIFGYIMTVVMGPEHQDWLPAVFREGKPLRKLAPFILMLGILASPSLVIHWKERRAEAVSADVELGVSRAVVTNIEENLHNVELPPMIDEIALLIALPVSPPSSAGSTYSGDSPDSERLSLESMTRSCSTLLVSPTPPTPTTSPIPLRGPPRARVRGNPRVSAPIPTPAAEPAPAPAAAPIVDHVTIIDDDNAQPTATEEQDQTGTAEWA
ncbi:uncharacterized protein SPSK_06601 [Sporothrix schenckii 1099-18]|uniref:Uncharacterized protein n=1 Tax=Sporothrix schenckii 1099-18 TaxID=1397361 RepID=A0A0F2MKW0_SPOSC|nr:uncharacterized protein SPSK_06601 [Sporothrix schenckii 1099-18]KJR89699.1 hypothetical protein SPSK_06601 [Sporothrix schenckii 1099-18]